MTRIRIKATVDTNDGGAFTGSNRPPTELLPAPFAKVLAEYDQTRSRLGLAESTLRELTNPGNWHVAQEEARKADKLAAAHAARDGNSSGTTTNIDALHAHERQARADVAALTGAIQLIADDLAALRAKAQEDTNKLDNSERDARAQLAKSLSQVTADAHAVSGIIALREWINNHAPWDPSVDIDVLDIWAPAHRIVDGASARIPVPLASITAALNNL